MCGLSVFGLAPVGKAVDVVGPKSDEYCPHCDNHFVLEAKTPLPALKVEGEDVRVDNRWVVCCCCCCCCLDVEGLLWVGWIGLMWLVGSGC